jgi:hypothetical protein
MIGMKADVEYVKGYSTALLCLGLFLLLGALQFGFLPHGNGHDPAFTLVASILCLLGIPCLVVALLRWMRLAAALPATVALSFCLLIVFPFGTLLSLYWLKNVQPKELPPQDHRAGLNFAVALYILSLLMLDMALVVHFIRGPSGQEFPVLKALEFGGWSLALVALVVGALRSASWRKGLPQSPAG